MSITETSCLNRLGLEGSRPFSQRVLSLWATETPAICRQYRHWPPIYFLIYVYLSDGGQQLVILYYTYQLFVYNFLEFFFQRQQSIGELATIQNANNPCLNAPNPCNNGGQCFYSQGSITCMCNEGFDGQRCEIDLCQSMSCPANAECRNGVCQCSEGFTSKYTYLLYLPISYHIYM